MLKPSRRGPDALSCRPPPCTRVLGLAAASKASSWTSKAGVSDVRWLRRRAETVRDLFSRPSSPSATYRAGDALFSTRRRRAGRRCLTPSTRRGNGDDVASMAREANAKGPRRSGAETHGKRCFRRYWKSRTAPAWAGATVARRHRLPSSYRYKRAALGRDDDAAAAMRPVQRPRVRRADRAPLMFVDCISVASVVVEAASRPRHLRACRCKKRQQRTLPVSLKLARRPLTACSGS